MSDKLRIGVVGLGFGAKTAQTIAMQDDAQVAAVADKVPDPRRMGAATIEEFARSVGAKAYSDGVEMMEKERLDGVYIGVSPKWRDDLVAKAAEKRLPIFLEKPFARDMEQGRRLADLCEKNKALVVVDFVLTHMPAVARLRELIAGELGKGLVLNGDLMIATANNPKAWTWDPDNGNGVINENTCHLFDTIRSLMGEAESLYAEGGSYLGSRLEDGAAMTIRFKSGAAAVLTGGGIAAQAFPQPPYLSLYAANGQAQLTGVQHMFGALTWATRKDKETKTETWELPPRGQIMIYALRHFMDCVRSGRKPLTGVAEGMQALALAMAVRESLEKKRPVRLNS